MKNGTEKSVIVKAEKNSQYNDSIIFLFRRPAIFVALKREIGVRTNKAECNNNENGKREAATNKL